MHLFRYIYIIHNFIDKSDRLFQPSGCNVLLKMTLKNRMEKIRFPPTPSAQKLKKIKSFKFSFFITRWHCSVSKSNCQELPKTDQLDSKVQSGKQAFQLTSNKQTGKIQQ